MRQIGMLLLIFELASPLPNDASPGKTRVEPQALEVLHLLANPIAAATPFVPSPATARVRSDHPPIAAAIVEAAEHSATFRSMIEAVDKTDGIVYLRDGTCRLRLRACLGGVYSAPPSRFVHIILDVRRVAGCEMMSAIGHELQHALEVLTNPKIVDSYTLANFYMRQGPTGDGVRLETPSAVRAGLQVERELRRHARCRR